MAGVANKGGFWHIPNVPPEKSYLQIFLSYITTFFGEGFLWSMKSVLLGTACLLYYLTPDSMDFANFGWREASFLFARNFGFYFAVTFALYLYFHVFKLQGDEFRYFQKHVGKKSEFTFGSQLRDNMFWSLASGVTVWTIYESIYYYLHANGMIASVDLGSVWGIVWFIVLLLLIPHWQAVHFYIYHRALHHPSVYRHFHALHHRNISLIPWSGISMHPVEHILYLCPWVIFLFMPSHPIHMLFFMHYLTVGASFSHSGYERLRLWGGLSFPIAGFYHQLHHRYYSCNYGNPDFPLDELGGTADSGAKLV